MKTLPIAALPPSEFGGKLLGYAPDGAPIYPITGAEGPGGYSTAGDILSTLGDGTDLNAVWSEFQQTLNIVNEQRSAVTNLLAFRTTRAVDAVAQTVDDEGFVRASEFGDPVSIASKPDVLKLGYDFVDFDLRVAMTWRFLRDATAEEVEALHARALAADNKLTTHDILGRVLDPTPGENNEGSTCYPLYNGDAMVPPKSGFTSFTAPHTHYLTTGSSAPDGADLDVMADHIRHHGYATVPGARLILFCNPTDLPALAKIRAEASGATYDFIPSSGAPAYLTDKEIIGDRAPGEFGTLKVSGSYGDVWILPVEFMPPTYLVMAATNGPNSPLNPIGFREHPRTDQQGLRLLPGNQQKYPLIDSYYCRGFGTGVRHRGAAVVMQITASASYTAPVL
jgi:hypothetical protein